MKLHNKIDSKENNTWCPGCANFITLSTFKKALIELNDEKKININATTIVTDIGCGGKIYDYINVNAVYALHGRVIPFATGIKVANPNLTVIGFGGDGGTYNTGMNHLIHSARRNVGITMIVANNGVFALTKGQPAATSDITKEQPINAIQIAKEAGATFVAKVSVFDPKKLQEVLKLAITHKGFSLVEIIQPCIIFRNNTEELRSEMINIEKTSSFISKPIIKKTWEENIR